MRRCKDYRLNIALAAPRLEWRAPASGVPVAEDSGPAPVDDAITERDLEDLLFADLDDDTLHTLAEHAAARGLDATSGLDIPYEESGLPAPLYPRRWTRVADEVFEQYAPLAQRRQS